MFRGFVTFGRAGCGSLGLGSTVLGSHKDSESLAPVTRKYLALLSLRFNFVKGSKQSFRPASFTERCAHKAKWSMCKRCFKMLQPSTLDPSIMHDAYTTPPPLQKVPSLNTEAL